MGKGVSTGGQGAMQLVYLVRGWTHVMATTVRLLRSPPPTPALLSATERRGVRYTGSPLGWWVVIDLPGGGTASVVTLQPGQYRLTLDRKGRRPGLPRVFTSAEAALDAALGPTPGRSEDERPPGARGARA